MKKNIFKEGWKEKNMNKVDKGFELVYWKLSYRRKFIRTLWMIPWAIVSLIFIQIVGKNYKYTILYTILAGIIYLVILPIQAIYNYKKWMKEEMKWYYAFLEKNKNLNFQALEVISVWLAKDIDDGVVRLKIKLQIKVINSVLVVFMNWFPFLVAWQSF